MSGDHARPTSGLFRSAPQTPPHATRHGRREGLGRRLRRRILAYRDIEFFSTHIPGEPGQAPGPGQECLLLVHVRKVVGQIHYRLCAACGEGVITGVDIDEHFLTSGLPTRALSHLHSRHPGITWRSTLALRTTRDLSHLHSRHPGITWRSTLALRTTRDLLRRMRIPTTSADTGCAHAPAVPDSLQPTR